MMKWPKSIKNLYKKISKKNQFRSEENLNLLLVMAPPWGVDNPYLALGYLNEYLTKNKISSKVFDLNIKLYNLADGKDKELWRMENYLHWTDKEKFKEIIKKFSGSIKRLILNEIKKSNIDVVGFSVNAGNYLSTKYIASFIKKENPEIIIVIGGPNVSIGEVQSNKELRRIIDYAIVSEGEKTFYELMACLNNKNCTRLAKRDNRKNKTKKSVFETGNYIPGIVYFDEKSNLALFKKRHLNERLETFPFPTYKGFNLKEYTGNFLSIIGSRGCIGKCSFCIDYRYFPGIRNRKAEDIFKEIKYHVTQNHIKSFDFRDLMLAGDIAEFAKLCDMIIKSNMKIKWRGQTMVRPKLTYEVLKKMKDSGCESLVYGIESFSDSVLKDMNKYFRSDLAERVIRDTSKAGIHTLINIIVGFPTETEDDFEKTLKTIIKNKKYIGTISSISPFLLIPNTTVGENPEKYGIVIDEKNKNNELFFRWKTKDGNTYEIRKKRILKLLDALNNNGIDYLLVNLYDEKPEAIDQIKKRGRKIQESKQKDRKSDFAKKEKKEETKKAIKPNIKSKIAKKIVLIGLPPWGTNSPPLGLGYLSAALSSENIDHDVFDFNIELYDSVKKDWAGLWHVENKNLWSDKKNYEEIEKLFSRQIKKAAEKIAEYDLACFSVVDPKENIAISLIKKIKEINPKTRIILGGPACATKLSRQKFYDTIPSLIDGYVIGEGERPLIEICKLIEDSKSKNTDETKEDKNNQKDVILAMLPPWGTDSPPLGIASILSYLKKNNIKADATDLNIELFSVAEKHEKKLFEMNKSTLWTQKESFEKIYERFRKEIDLFIEKIIKKRPKLVGFSVQSTASFLILKKIAEEIKNQDKTIKIAVGGFAATIDDQRQELSAIAKDKIDYYILGEGEKAFLKLAEAIKYNKQPESVAIIQKAKISNKSKEAVRKSSLELDIKDLPIPDYTWADLEKYTRRSLNIEFSRGCIGNCTFCSFKKISPVTKSKTPEQIVSELKYYIKKYKIVHFSIVDPAVNSDMKMLEAVCELIIKNNLKINLSALAIPRKEMTYEILSKMKKAGFYRLEYGIESGSDKILKDMHKIFDSETAFKVLKNTRKARIESVVYFIVGYPGETQKEFSKTKEFIKKSKDLISLIKSINPLYLMSGSFLRENPEKYNIEVPEKEADIFWKIKASTQKENNNYEMRRKRVVELKRLAIDCMIPLSEEADSERFILKEKEKNGP